LIIKDAKSVAENEDSCPKNAPIGVLLALSITELEFIKFSKFFD